ncbi:MAG: D-alanyl-D-alanine carboxypeptidase/D-alanyl-D-alanine-endopeptidase, partial [Endomicrobiales bacterium]
RESKPQVRIVPETSYATVISSITTADSEDVHIIRQDDASGDRFVVTGTVIAGGPEKKWRCAVSHPALYAGTLFKDLLLKYGLTIEGTLYEGTVSTATLGVDQFSSKTMSDIVCYFLKESDNLTGECILKTLGASPDAPPGDAAKGIGVVQKTLSALGIKPESYSLVDGSGLSSYDLLSPNIVTQVLSKAYGDLSVFPELSSALSIAGIDGTLRDRMKATVLAKFVRGKTGTMSGVSCVSGYVQTRKGTVLAVSIMMNGFTGSAQPFQEVQDKILQILWESY